MAKKYTVVSLFTGAGGMDLGFSGGFEFLGKKYSKNPFDIIFANDIFPQAANSYEHNLKRQVERRDITKLEEKDFPTAQVDLILGGFPCQPFSLSGKREGFQDDRGELYQHMLRVISHYKPKMFIAENVNGICSTSKNNEGDELEPALIRIIKDFELAGYAVQYRTLNAADYGVPQKRKRVIIVGIRNDLNLDYEYPHPTRSKTGESGLPKWLTAYDAIEDLWGTQGITSIPNHTEKDISGGKFYPGRKMQGNNRIQKNAPSPTIRAEHHGNIEAHYNTNLPNEHDMNGWRRLSVRECARLQSFPDSYLFTSKAYPAYRMIGNAVPPVLAWHIARSAVEILNRT